MFLKQVFMCLCGAGFGVLASAGVFTVLVSVGLIPRFAGKMHVAKHVLLLEDGVILGTISGCIVSVFSDYFYIENQTFGSIFIICYGFFAGIFVGCLALAIAEMLNSIPIFSRRIGFRHGLGVAITAAAIGKLVGSLSYFAFRIFESCS